MEVLRFNLNNFYGVIRSVRQSVTGQGRIVTIAASGVEAPVFRNAEIGVVAPLVNDVSIFGGLGGHLQHEVGGLALISDGVAVLLDEQRPVHLEGDEHVGDAVACLLAGSPSHRHLAEDDG